MKPLRDERILVDQSPLDITLTTHRVRAFSERFGTMYMASIMLEDVTCCTVAVASQPLYFYVSLGLLAVAASGLGGGDDSHRATPFMMVVTLVAVAFGIVFLYSRRKVVRIAGAGGMIQRELGRVPLARALEFIDEIESAKNDRVTWLGHSPTP